LDLSFSKAMRYLDDRFGCPYRIYHESPGGLTPVATGTIPKPTPGNDLMGTVVGNAVHAAIEEYITDWRNDSTLTPSLVDIRQTALNYIENSWDVDFTARMISDRGRFDVKEWPKIKSRHIAQAKKMMLAFVKHWNVNGFQTMQCYALEEQWQEEPPPPLLNEHLRLYGTIDFCAYDPTNDVYYIVDWKSGHKPKAHFDESQLMCYAYLLHITKKIDYSKMRCQFISMMDGEQSLHHPTAQSQQEFSDWLAYIPYYLEEPDEAREDAQPSYDKCRSCHHRTDCSEAVS